MSITPILLKGAGRMGGAMLAGWRRAGAFAASDLIVADPFPGEDAAAAVGEGARLNPGDDALAEAKTVALAVKPQIWREAAAELAPHLAADAVVVSICAGVALGDIEAVIGR